MPPFLYRCPNTGQNVQAWAADDPDDDDLTYAQVTCLACAQAHLVNPTVDDGHEPLRPSPPLTAGTNGFLIFSQ